MSLSSPGDLVVCIEGQYAPGCEIVKGRIYVVTEVARSEELGECEHGPWCLRGGFNLREAPLNNGFYWCAGCFRPVGKPAADFIASMLEAPADKVTP